MKLRRIACTPFRIPFRRPLQIGPVTVSARTGLLLEAQGENGLVGLGEVAPHPTAEPVRLREAAGALARLADLVSRRGGADVDVRRPDPLGVPLPAEARPGLEMACCDLAARTKGVTVAELFGPVLREMIPVNAIIDDLEPERAGLAAGQLVAAGFTCFKLKVSRDLPLDGARLAAVRQAAGPAVEIRIDANGVWSPDEAIRALQAFAAYDIAYVEQPVRALADLARVAEAVSTPIAADECVTDAEAVKRIAALHAATVIVIKPALLGLGQAADVIRAARECGLKAVVTSALDTSIGLAAAAQLAATLPDPVLACGLATTGLLAGDLVREPVVARAGWLRCPSGAGLGVAVDEQACARWRHALT